MTDFIMTNLQGILMGAALLGIGVAALFGFTRAGELDGEKILLYRKEKAKWPILGAVVALLLVSSAAFVPKGYAGVIYDWNGGIQADARPEGLNLMVPFKQHMTNVDVRAQAWVFNDENVYVHTKDFHEIRIPYTIIYRVSPELAPHVLKTVAGDPAETILGPVANRSVRNEVGLVVLDDLARNVNQISDSVLAEIARLATPHGLEVVGFEPQDTVVRQAYIDAVERERISERDILTATNLVKVAEQEAIQKSFEADGIRFIGNAEADVAEALALSVTNDVVQYELARQGIRYLPNVLVGEAVDILLTPPLDE